MTCVLRRLTLSAVVIVIAACISSPPVFAVAAPLAACHDAAGAVAGTGAVIGQVNRACAVGRPAAGDGGSRHAAAPARRVVDCGPPQVLGQVRPVAGEVCGQLRGICDVASAAALPVDPHITTTVTLQRAGDGNWRAVGSNCAARSAAPQVTALAVMREIRKLVPHPKIGVAPPGGATLVNIQTLLWADTPPDQSLAAVTLLGHRVALRVHVAQVDWDFGDGNSDVTTGPERKYDPGDGCHTAMCPGYWGHIYATTGAMTITATVQWSGQYRVDAGAWLDVPDTVTGPASTVALRVREARGVLVPDPTGH